MNDGDDPAGTRDAEELEPVEALEELLEEIVDGLGLDVELRIDEEDGVLSGRLEARTSGCSSVATVRRSTLCSTWHSGSSSRMDHPRCGW